jgi:hypothetical protein
MFPQLAKWNCFASLAMTTKLTVFLINQMVETRKAAR